MPEPTFLELFGRLERTPRFHARERGGRDPVQEPQYVPDPGRRQESALSTHFLHIAVGVLYRKVRVMPAESADEGWGSLKARKFRECPPQQKIAGKPCRADCRHRIRW